MNAAVTNSPSAPAHPPQAAPDIRERFAAARAAGKRAKDAAESLGLSEGAAVAAHAGEHGHPLKAQPLQGSWLELLQSLEACGPLMALTRNEGTVHEKTGVYTHVAATGPVGIALGEDIDLRLFFSHWAQAFAVEEHTGPCGAQDLHARCHRPGCVRRSGEPLRATQRRLPVWSGARASDRTA